MITVPIVSNLPVEEAMKVCSRIYQSLSTQNQGTLLDQFDVLHRASVNEARDELHDHGMNDVRSLRLEQEKV